MHKMKIFILIHNFIYFLLLFLFWFALVCTSPSSACTYKTEYFVNLLVYFVRCVAIVAAAFNHFESCSKFNAIWFILFHHMDRPEVWGRKKRNQTKSKSKVKCQFRLFSVHIMFLIIFFINECIIHSFIHIHFSFIHAFHLIVQTNKKKIELIRGASLCGSITKWNDYERDRARIVWINVSAT